MRKFIATLFLTGALAVGSVAPMATAAPVVTGGLVNVTVTDVDLNVLNYNNIGVAAALGIAANVCDVSVAVLANQLGTGSSTCTNEVDGTTATITQGIRH
jgi:hypothetical protein